MVISKESINYSLRNLRKSKGRSFLTVLSIFVGIATIFIFVSFGLGLYSYIDSFKTSSSADKLMIMAKGIGAPGLDDTFKLTDDDLDAVRKTQGVYEATGVYFKVAEAIQGNTKKYVYAVAYDPGEPLMMEFYDIDIAKGRLLQKGDNGKVVLGYNYMFEDKIFPKALDINSKIEIQGVDLKVVGFMESIGNPQDDSQIYLINDYFDEVFVNGTASYGMLIARVDPNDIKGTALRVEKNLRNERNLDVGKEDFQVQSFEDILESFSGALNIIIGFVILIALISVVVSAVNTANTMITSVLERYREIGVLKSIGARNSEIFKIFLFESGFLGFIAGVIGVLIGWGLSALGGKILKDLGWGFLQPLYSWELFVGCVAFATITGAVSGVIPAWRASKINAVDALRYE